MISSLLCRKVRMVVDIWMVVFHVFGLLEYTLLTQLRTQSVIMVGGAPFELHRCINSTAFDSVRPGIPCPLRSSSAFVIICFVAASAVLWPSLQQLLRGRFFMDWRVDSTGKTSSREKEQGRALFMLEHLIIADRAYVRPMRW